MARMVTFPTVSGDGQGLLAVPQAPGPGVLLLPNFRGLAPDTVAAAQLLARAGCPTLAVDFLHRVTLRFDDFYEQAPAALLSLDLGTLADDINGAAAFPAAPPCSGAHVCALATGGGALALWAAHTPRVMTVSAAYPAATGRAEAPTARFTAARAVAPGRRRHHFTPATPSSSATSCSPPHQREIVPTGHAPRLPGRHPPDLFKPPPPSWCSSALRPRPLGGGASCARRD